MARLDVGVDVGGTFTDFVAAGRDGRLRVAKVPTTSPDSSAGVLAGLQRLLGPGDSLRWLIHGTTVVTNAVLEGKGARTALVTTRGFRDVLEIGRQNREHLYRLDVPGRQPPPVPRHLRFEVRERVDHQGNVLVPLEEGELEALRTQLRAAGVEAVAVCLLHSYARPDHERRIGAALAGVVPYVALSSEVNPEFREFERMHTTCVNAMLLPLVDRYLTALEQALAGVPVRLVQSSGGMITPGLARRVPLAMLFSGPAGGVAAAAATVRRLGIPAAVTLDMGGTSTDVCLVRDGRAETTTERRLGGHPVRVRSLAVESIGAGGGSVAWLDEVGRLRVGPRSAGSTPGPICYGRGGREPTVTDADAVLGYLDPQAVLGGAIRLDVAAAREAFAVLGRRLGLTAEEAALGVIEIATEAMRGAVRLVSVQRGYDLREMTLVAYGGAGPVHAALLARALGVREVLVPALSSFFSAYGCLVADLRFDSVRTFRRRLTWGVQEELQSQFVDLETDLIARLRNEGISEQAIMLQRSLDLRYLGQNYELEVPLAGSLDPLEIRAAFQRVHQQVYGYTAEDPVEIVALRATAVVPSEVQAVPSAAEEGRGEPVAERQAFLPGAGWARVPVYLRDGVAAHRPVEGPAILQDAWSTILVLPGQCFLRDGEGNVWIREVGR